ncbi:uncharacterized protein LOC142331193 isoform X3 [Lycorma delicatula]|uniref:uncharacterized protein LOC142331193 isoform X3 n=1 Tax=Lycorma delicatula TaxID=130591 RepID=UPI003F51A81B
MDAQTNDSVLEENPLSLPIKKEDMHETGQQEYLFVHFAKTDDKLTIFKQSMDAQTDSSFFDEDPLSSSIKQEIKHETERTVHLIAPVAMIDDKLTTSRQIYFLISQLHSTPFNVCGSFGLVITNAIIIKVLYEIVNQLILIFQLDRDEL